MFDLSSGYDGFDTPAGMIQVANALAARTATRDNRYEAARVTLLEVLLMRMETWFRGLNYVFHQCG